MGPHPADPASTSARPTRRLFVLALAAAAALRPVAAVAHVSSEPPADGALDGWPAFAPASILSRWTAVLRRHAEQELRPGARLHAADRRWRAWQAGLAGLSPAAQRARIDAEVNRVPYIAEAPGTDRWETPREFIANGGDCEDYAIAKYLLLRGAEPATGPFLIVATARGRPHAMCGIAVPGGYAVLDNLRPAIAVVRHLNAVAPIYLLDEQALYLPPPDARRLADRRH